MRRGRGHPPKPPGSAPALHTHSAPPGTGVPAPPRPQAVAMAPAGTSPPPPPLVRAALTHLLTGAAALPGRRGCAGSEVKRRARPVGRGELRRRLPWQPRGAAGVTYHVRGAESGPVAAPRRSFTSNLHTALGARPASLRLVCISLERAPHRIRRQGCRGHLNLICIPHSLPPPDLHLICVRPGRDCGAGGGPGVPRGAGPRSASPAARLTSEVPGGDVTAVGCGR